MRFIHIADVHLGMQPDAGFPWSEERGESIWESFRRIIRLVGREKPDFLLIAGDLFQRQPLLRELKEVNDLFASIPETIVVRDCRKPRLCEAGEFLPRLRLGGQRGAAAVAGAGVRRSAGEEDGGLRMQL